MVILGVFVVYTLWLLRVLGVLNCLVTLLVWDLINFRNKASLSSHNIVSSMTCIITDYSEALSPWEGSEIWAIWLRPLFSSCIYFYIRLTYFSRFSCNFSYPWVWLLVKLLSQSIASLKVYHSNRNILDLERKFYDEIQDTFWTPNQSNLE